MNFIENSIKTENYTDFFILKKTKERKTVLKGQSTFTFDMKNRRVFAYLNCFHQKY